MGPKGSNFVGFLRYVVHVSNQRSGGIELNLRPGSIARGRIRFPKMVMGEEPRIAVLREHRLPQRPTKMFKAARMIAGTGEHAPQFELPCERQLRVSVLFRDRNELSRRVERLARTSGCLRDLHP